MKCNCCKKELTEKDPTTLRWVKRLEKMQPYYIGLCCACNLFSCNKRYWKKRGTDKLREEITKQTRQVEHLHTILKEMEKTE